MQRRILAGERLVAAFLCGCLLFNYPLLSLFDSGGSLFGVPLLYAYVFFAWAGLIAMMAWIIEGQSE
jgi:hypothetical protein